MKKIIYAAVLLLIIGIAAISCKKDSTAKFGTSVGGTESIFSSGIFDVPAFSGNKTKRNRGYEFKANKAGRITHLGAKISKGTYVVTLWDSTAQNIIKAVNVTNTDSTQYAYTDIDDVTIQAGKVYVITVYNEPVGGTTQNNIWYSGITSPSNNLPQTVGDITFMAYVERNATTATELFPYSFGKAFDYILGFPSFKFEPAL